MPDTDGKLSTEEYVELTHKFEAFEAEIGHDLKCEVCGNIVWTLNQNLLTLYSDSPSGPLGAKRRVPLIHWYCSNCGNAKLFAAKLWDIEASAPEGAGAVAGPRVRPFKITSRDQLKQITDESDGD